MRTIAAAMLVAAAFGSFGCGDADPYFDGSPEVADKAPDGREWRQLETVRAFGPSSQLRPAEVRRARRIIDRDRSLAPLLRDADGYAVSRIGSVSSGGRAALVGATADIRLDSPISGTYRLPMACTDLEGEFVPAGADPYRFEGVDTLMVEVSFAEDRVFEIQPGIDSHGTYEPPEDPGTWPQSCRDAAEQTIGD